MHRISSIIAAWNPFFENPEIEPPCTSVILALSLQIKGRSDINRIRT